MRKIILLLAFGFVFSACVGSGTSDTTTTTLDPLIFRGWTDEAFRHAVSYCQASGDFDTCTLFITNLRDGGECSVVGVLIILDHMDGTEADEREDAQDVIMRTLQKEDDCLGYPIASG